MAYLFDDFKNIRTFPAATRVYRGGVFAPDLSEDLDDASLPLHIIHIGEISGAQKWFIDMNEPRDVFLTARIATADAKIDIEVNPNLPKLSFDGLVFCKNTGKVLINIIGNNNRDNTKIRIATRLFAAAGSESVLSGLANIPVENVGSETDISFSALCDPAAALVKMAPAQRISSVPADARHAASIYRPAKRQIEYLETAGLTPAAAAELLNKTFLEEAM